MNKTTERRLKLFEDAEHFGAVVLDSDGWKCAVCRTYEQLHCFGRAKPKVKPGTNEIDQASNLRDDEGITPEAKAVRDSATAQWVKDGLSFDDQPYEAGWCVAGGDVERYPGSDLGWHPTKVCSSYEHGDVYANAKVKGEQCPYVIFLELGTGKLYISNLQYSKWGMMPLKDGWVVSDYNNERNGFNEGGVERRIKSDDRFATIFQLAAEESLKGLTGAPEKIDVRNPERPAPRPSYGQTFPPRQARANNKGLTVRQLYSKIYRLVGPNASSSISFMYSEGRTTSQVKRIKEGLGSSMVFDTRLNPRLSAVTLKDFVAYIKRRLDDDKKFQWTKVYGGPDRRPIKDVKFRFGCLELS